MPALVCLGCALLLAANSTAPAVVVRGDTACPTASEVSAALIGLMAAPPNPAVGPDVVELSDRGKSVVVKLANASEVIAVKRLPATLSCTERARAAAVIVAAWEVRLRAGVRPMLPIVLPPRPHSPPSTASTAPTGPTVPTVATALPNSAPVPVSVLAPVLAPSPVPTSTPGPSAPPPLPPASAERTTRDSDLTAGVQTRSGGPIEVETGAAILASVAAGAVSPGVMLEATFARRDSRFAVGIGGLAVGTHATPVGLGEGAWRRFGGVFDLRSISRWRPLQLEMQAGLALTALTITGRSLPVTSGATIFDPGLLAGLRLRFRIGRLSPWVQATAVFWPRTHNLYVTGTANSSDLSPFEALLGVGFSLGPER